MLSDTRVKTAKPAEKIYKLYDENGLYLEVPPTGKKRWRFRFSWQGKERRISLGVYPDISLKQARDRCQEARAQVADGVAPGGTRKSVAPAEHALKDVAEAWITAKKLRGGTRIWKRSISGCQPTSTRRWGNGA